MYFTILLIVIAIGLLWGFLFLLKRFYDLEEHSISVDPGVLTWRTKYGLGVLDRIAKSSKRFWRIFGRIGAGTSIVLMGVMFFLIVSSAFILSTQGAPPGIEGRPGVMPVVPGITTPLVAGIIALIIVLLTHEPAHGIIARSVDIDIKSTGLALFLVIPGAFVEEDEEEFENASPFDRIQMAGAGPFANILLGLACLLLILGLISPLPGLFVSDTLENYPAEKAGLPPGSRLIRIDNVVIDSYSDFDGYLDNKDPGQRVTLFTSENKYDIVLENKEYKVGVSVVPITSVSKYALLRPSGIYSVAFSEIFSSFYQGIPLISAYTYEGSVPWSVLNVLKWIFTLNLLVGLFNLLPLKPLDGGHIVEGLAEKITSKPRANDIANWVSGITLVVILITAVLPML